jgi:hypothetical protein
MQRSRLYFRNVSLGLLPIQTTKKVCSARLGVNVAAGANTFLAHAYEDCVGGGESRLMFYLLSKDPVVFFA